MAKLADLSTYVSGSPKTVCTKSGHLVAILASHDQSSAQEVVFYDYHTTGTSEILRLAIAPEVSPFYVEFPKDYTIYFANGLTIDPGTYCHVQVMIETG